MRTTCAVAPIRNARIAMPIAAFKPGSSGGSGPGRTDGIRVEVSVKAGIMWKNQVSE